MAERTQQMMGALHVAPMKYFTIVTTVGSFDPLDLPEGMLDFTDAQ